jgi:hypothetical protein
LLQLFSVPTTGVAQDVYVAMRSRATKTKGYDHSNQPGSSC